MLTKNCKHHGLTEGYHTKEGHLKCKRCNVEKVSESRRRLKARLVEHFGGKCQRCGYDKCKKALQFHHKDRGQKTFGIGSGDCKSWAKCVAEAEKCDLLCANCHFEVEDEIWLGSSEGRAALC